MTEHGKKNNAWEEQTSHEKKGYYQLKLDAISNIFTILLTAAIIVGGFMLPTLVYPYLDAHSNRLTRLANSSDETMASHVFEQPVTLYPWNIEDNAQLRSLTSAEMATLEQSGVPRLLIDTMVLRGMQLQHDSVVYVSQILNNFRFLESTNSDEPSCFVLIDEDIDSDGEIDVNCATDYQGNIISLLFVTTTKNKIQLTAPIEIPSELTAGAESSGGETAGANNATASDAEQPPTTPEDPQADYRRPLQEEENIWMFSYMLSREALLVGQRDVYSIFRQLELRYETNFGYPYTNLLPTPYSGVEVLPEVEQLTITDSPPLNTEDHLLRIYDISGTVRLILYINSSTQNCDGFIFTTMPT